MGHAAGIEGVEDGRVKSTRKKPAGINSTGTCQFDRNGGFGISTVEVNHVKYRFQGKNI